MSGRPPAPTRQQCSVGAWLPSCRKAGWEPKLLPPILQKCLMGAQPYFVPYKIGHPREENAAWQAVPHSRP
eukprot:scaffold18774_cov220-Cylindrotheca_fusiformis.AAC.4